jgi:hypothetical protein
MREAYWKYFSGPYSEDGTHGLEARKDNVHLSLGIAWHKGAEKLLAGENGTTAAIAAIEEADKYPSINDIWKNWLLAACLAWEQACAEEFFGRYDVLGIEEELDVYLAPNVVLKARVDAILQDRSDGSFWVWNWKTTGDVRNWTEKWHFDIQSWTEAIAWEGKVGDVAGCIYGGVWKGPMWKGSTTSRLVYAYKRSKEDGTVTYSRERVSGYDRVPVWEESFPFGDGIPAWISWLPKDFLRSHFPISAPHMRDDITVNEWVKAIVRREDDIAHVVKEANELDKRAFFVQNFGNQCSGCPYVDLCMHRTEPESLIEEGYLTPRVDRYKLKEEEDEQLQSSD